MHGKLSMLEIQSLLFALVQKGQDKDPLLLQIRDEVLNGKAPRFLVYKDGVLGIWKLFLCSAYEDLRRTVMTKVHAPPYSVHPGMSKMHKDLKQP